MTTRFLATALVGAGLVTLFTATACDLVTEKGNGELKTETRSLSDFTKIDLGLSGKAVIRQGAAFKVEVVAESNLLNLIETEVDGSTLKIGCKGSISPTEDITYNITMPQLEGAEIGGSGSVQVADIFSPDKLVLKIGGSGNIRGEFIAKAIEADIAGSGSIYLKGSAQNLEADIAGSGNIEAQDLKAQEVDVDIAGSGSATVFAQVGLEIDIAGSGSVKYKGSPSKIKQDIKGSGRVSTL
jgi:hypothetical protein